MSHLNASVFSPANEGVENDENRPSFGRIRGKNGSQPRQREVAEQVESRRGLPAKALGSDSPWVADLNREGFRRRRVNCRVRGKAFVSRGDGQPRQPLVTAVDRSYGCGCQ